MGSASYVRNPYLRVFLVIVLLLQVPGTFTLSRKSFAQASRVAVYDLDGSNRVDAGDLLLMAASMSRGGVGGDLNGDGKTDAADLFLLSSKWAMTVGFAGPLPPDPVAVAPPVDRSVASNLSTGTQFLYAGDDPIQIEVAPNTIEAGRVAVLRGKVMTRDEEPLPGVQISILGHPEFIRSVVMMGCLIWPSTAAACSLSTTRRKAFSLPSGR